LHKVAEELGRRSILRSGVVCRVSNAHPIDASSEAVPLAEL
jgi:hypothetical protein